jgi:ribosome-associated translation inhibitor RaiA
MTATLQITFRSMDPSPAVEDCIREAAAKLETIEPRLTRCHATVETRHRRHHKGSLFHVGIDLTVPGAEIAISRDPEMDHGHEDVYVAVHHAFDAAKRRLMAQPRRRRSREDATVREEEPA